MLVSKALFPHAGQENSKSDLLITPLLFMILRGENAKTPLPGRNAGAMLGGIAALYRGAGAPTNKKGIGRDEAEES